MTWNWWWTRNWQNNGKNCSNCLPSDHECSGCSCFFVWWISTRNFNSSKTETSWLAIRKIFSLCSMSLSTKRNLGSLSFSVKDFTWKTFWIYANRLQLISVTECFVYNAFNSALCGCLYLAVNSAFSRDPVMWNALWCSYFGQAQHKTDFVQVIFNVIAEFYQHLDHLKPFPQSLKMDRRICTPHHVLHGRCHHHCLACWVLFHIVMFLNQISCLACDLYYQKSKKLIFPWYTTSL